MTRPTHDAVPDRIRPTAADPRATHDADGPTLRVEDALVRAAAAAAAAAISAHDPAAAPLYEWLAADARAARTVAEGRRDARRAERFAASMVARCGLERARRRIAGPVAGAPVEIAATPLSVAEAVTRASAARAAPLLDLRVAAGDGRLLWEQACDRWVALPPGVAPGRHVALGVAGDSMCPLLEAGDTILVRLDAEPTTGAIVVARTAGGGYVVKQVGALGPRTVELRSLNPAYRPRRVRRGPGVVLGVVVAWWGVWGRRGRGTHPAEPQPVA